MSVTITDCETACCIKTMRFTVSPVVRVAVSVKNPVNLPKLVEGLRKLSKSDPMVRCETTEAGEHIVAGCGELHLEICLKDLADDFMKGAPITTSKPVVTFCETVIKESSEVLSKSANKHDRLFCTAMPLSEQVDEQVLTPGMDVKERSKLLREHPALGWEVAATSQKIWCFGDDGIGPNVVNERTVSVGASVAIAGAGVGADPDQVDSTTGAGEDADSIESAGAEALNENFVVVHVREQGGEEVLLQVARNTPIMQAYRKEKAVRAIQQRTWPETLLRLRRSKLLQDGVLVHNRATAESLGLHEGHHYCIDMVSQQVGGTDLGSNNSGSGGVGASAQETSAKLADIIKERNRYVLFSIERRCSPLALAVNAGELERLQELLQTETILQQFCSPSIYLVTAVCPTGEGSPRSVDTTIVVVNTLLDLVKVHRPALFRQSLTDVMAMVEPFQEYTALMSSLGQRWVTLPPAGIPSGSSATASAFAGSAAALESKEDKDGELGGLGNLGELGEHTQEEDTFSLELDLLEALHEHVRNAFRREDPEHKRHYAQDRKTTAGDFRPVSKLGICAIPTGGIATISKRAPALASSSQADSNDKFKIGVPNVSAESLEEVAGAAEATATTKAPKKRGRPRKSASVPAPAPALAPALAPAPAAQPAAPPAALDTCVGPGSSSNVFELGVPSVSAESLEEAAVAAEATVTTKAPRKRGRPRKSASVPAPAPAPVPAPATIAVAAPVAAGDNTGFSSAGGRSLRSRAAAVASTALPTSSSEPTTSTTSAPSAPSAHSSASASATTAGDAAPVSARRKAAGSAQGKGTPSFGVSSSTNVSLSALVPIPAISVTDCSGAALVSSGAAKRKLSEDSASEEGADAVADFAAAAPAKRYKAVATMTSPVQASATDAGTTAAISTSTDSGALRATSSSASSSVIHGGSAASSGAASAAAAVASFGTTSESQTARAARKSEKIKTD